MSFNTDIINPYIRVARHSILSAGSEIKRRVIFDYELIFIKDGEFALNYNDCIYNCTKGQFLLLRPGIPHSFYGINNDLSQPHIHFDMIYSEYSSQIPISFKDICDFTIDEKKFLQKDIFISYEPSPFITFADNKKAIELFYSIINIKETPRETKLSQKAHLLQLIDMLIADNFPDCSTTNAKSNSFLQQVKDYIDAGQGMSMTLDNIARQFNYSKYYIEREFKKHYGISLIAYRNEKRMLLAKNLLPNETVSAVSEKLGFTSIYVFSRAFKNYFGVSPSAYTSTPKEKS